VRIISTGRVSTIIKNPLTEVEFKRQIANAQNRVALSIADKFPVDWHYNEHGDIVIEVSSYVMTKE
jgi:hypothetical protein